LAARLTRFGNASRAAGWHAAGATWEFSAWNASRRVFHTVSQPARRGASRRAHFGHSRKSANQWKFLPNGGSTMLRQFCVDEN
jgi:hypothetical protein